MYIVSFRNSCRLSISNVVYASFNGVIVNAKNQFVLYVEVLFVTMRLARVDI